MFSNPLKRKQTNLQQGKKSPNGIECSKFKQPKISGEIKEIVEQRTLLPFSLGEKNLYKKQNSMIQLS